MKLYDSLQDGEEIVAEGAFSVDAAAQLEGKPSMMNQETSSTDTHPMTRSHRMSEQIKVSGNGEMCKERIESAAKSVAGVVSAEWSSETKMFQVKFDASQTNSHAIQKALAKVGRDTENFKAPENVYSKLPECCLYRK